jgi:hypothetical protein
MGLNRAWRLGGVGIGDKPLTTAHCRRMGWLIGESGLAGGFAPSGVTGARLKRTGGRADNEIRRMLSETLSDARRRLGKLVRFLI